MAGEGQGIRQKLSHGGQYEQAPVTRELQAGAWVPLARRTSSDLDSYGPTRPLAWAGAQGITAFETTCRDTRAVQGHF